MGEDKKMTPDLNLVTFLTAVDEEHLQEAEASTRKHFANKPRMGTSTKSVAAQVDTVTRAVPALDATQIIPDRRTSTDIQVKTERRESSRPVTEEDIQAMV